MPISEFCSPGTVVVDKNASLRMAAALMKRQHVGTVIVMERNGRPRPVGILTDRDIVLKVIAEGVNPDQVAARDVMSKNLVTIQKTAGMGEAVRLMRQKGVRRLLVVDDKGELGGVLSADDLVQMLGRELNAIGELYMLQPRHEDKWVPLVDASMRE